jgi:arylsulfatase A-like enzyme
VPERRVSDEMVHMTDVFPSFLAASGGSPAPAWKVDGLDLLPAWEGKSRVPERTLFWEWRAEGYQQLAAMRGDHKLVLTGANPPELFNVVDDPGERRSIREEYPESAKRLQDELKAWLATETEASRWAMLPPNKRQPAR